MTFPIVSFACFLSCRAVSSFDPRLPPLWMIPRVRMQQTPDEDDDENETPSPEGENTPLMEGVESKSQDSASDVGKGGGSGRGSYTQPDKPPQAQHQGPMRWI